MIQQEYVVTLPVKALGVGIGLQYIKRVSSYRRHLCTTSLHLKGARHYKTRAAALKAAQWFTGTVVPL
jgi:hypothetical protein